MDNKHGLIFIYGAGLGDYIWEETREHLYSAILIIQFPNRGAGDQANKGIPFESYLDSAIQQIESWDMDRFTIIAHFIGGGLGLLLCDHFKDSVNGFISISAILPQSGKSFTDCFPFPQNLLLPLILKIFGTTPPRKSIEKELCSDLSALQAEEVIKQFTPESIKLYTSKITYASLPKACLYIKLTQDQAISHSMQDAMINNLNQTTVIELDSGHLPMISKPKELAGIISRWIQETP